MQFFCCKPTQSSAEGKVKRECYVMTNGSTNQSRQQKSICYSRLIKGMTWDDHSAA
jgi:hypothetical protein